MKTIRLNWALLLAFATLWSYGLFGAGFTSAASSDAQFWITGLFASALFGFYCYAWQGNWNSFKSPFLFDFKDLLHLAIAGGVLGFMAWPFLHHAIEGDQVYHAQRSLIHPLFALAKTHGLVEGPGDRTAQTLLWMLSGGMLLPVLLFFYFILKSPREEASGFRIFLGIIFILGARYVLREMGGNPDPHAPFRLFPLWLSASIFGPSDFAFRFPQFLALVGLSWAVYRWLNQYCTAWISTVVGIAAASLPLVFHVGTLVEQSIYACLAWTIVLLGLERSGSSMQASGWISMAALMRFPSFLAAVPIGGLWFIKTRRISVLFPFAILIPLILQSLILGTPSAPPGMVASTPSIQTVFDVLMKDLGPIGVALLGLGLLLSWFDDQRRITPVKGFAVTGLFLLGTKAFYSILPEIWGACRYQAEYAAPFSILGLVLGFQRLHAFLRKRFLVLRWALPLGCVAGILWTSYQTLTHLPEQTLPADQRKSSPWMQTKILAEGVYNFQDAFETVQRDGFAGMTYVHGTVYGTFAEILYGWKWSEVQAQQKLLQEICQSPKTWLMGCPNIPDGRALHKNANVRAVLLANLDGTLIANDLLSLGWVERPAFKNVRWGSTIRYLVRTGPK